MASGSHEKEVVEVLVIEAHEGELDAGEFARLDVRFGRPEAQRSDLLPVRSVGEPLPAPGIFMI